jgi:alkylation response protein AidB-like acyl-CoA dehydrogenase
MMNELVALAGDLVPGLADAKGVPLGGRTDEHDRLRAAGADDLAWGRLYEGHVNALQLIGRLGSDDQRGRAREDASDGRLFGVWNTEAADGVKIVGIDRDGLKLTGRKTFASGAGRVARAIISAAWPDGTAQLVVVPMDRVVVKVDRSFWKPYGMEDSDSFAVDFDGVHIGGRDVLGEPDAYARSPWFTAGASRFVAVQTGALERLVADFGAFLVRRKQSDDSVQLERLGENVVDAQSAVLWTEACARAWAAYDAQPDAAHESALLLAVDAARNAVERAALAIAERVERGVGARGLLETEPFARRLRDLRMYLRQPAIDATLARVARSALAPRAIS